MQYPIQQSAIGRLARRLVVTWGVMGGLVMGPAVASAQELATAPRVTVWLASGRQMTAALDPRSNEDHLWLVRGEAGLSIARPIAWDRVVQAQHEDAPLSVDELRALALSLVAPEEPPRPVAPPARWAGVFAAPSSESETPSAPRRAVRSLAIDAYFARWSAGVETDGLVVMVYPLDAEGLIVPVTGTLEVELFAPEVRTFHEAPRGRGLTLERIGRWSESLGADDFATGGARRDLPYQARHPEYTQRVLPRGIVHARLSVPGEGVFEASLDAVRLRPWTPLRDNLWRDTGRRFLPTERTERGRGAG